eukprot:UN01206
MSADNCFYLMANGQIESCNVSGYDRIYSKYSINFGADWKCVNGVETGISQTSRKNPLQKFGFLWNYPFDLTFKSFNPTGWPQIIISVYTLNSWTSDDIVGYASVRIPIFPGRYVIEADLFRPVSSNWFSELVATFKGNKPEYFDTTFITQSKNREITRVTSNGKVKVVFNVMTKNLKSFGYSVKDEFINKEE